MLLMIMALIGLNFYSVFKGGAELDEQIKTYKAVVLRKQYLLNEISSYNTTMKDMLFMHFAEDNPKLMQYYEREFAALQNRCEKKYKELADMLNSQGERAMLQSLQRLKSRYYLQCDYFVKLSKDGNKVDAKSHYGRSFYYSCTLFNAQLQSISNQIDKSSATYYDSLKENISGTYKTIKRISAWGVLFVILLVLIAYVTINKLNKNNLDLAILLENKEEKEKEINSLNKDLGNIVIQRTKDLEVASNELNQQIEALNAAAIVSVTDAKGDIVFVNDMFCKVSGYSRSEVLGKNHRMLKSGKQPDGLFTGMWASISKGLVWNGVIQNKTKNGSFYWVNSTIMPFKDAEGNITKYVAIRFDISKEVEQQRILQEQTKQLKASEEELKIQHEELMSTNQELEEKGELLQERNLIINQKHQELEKASIELEKKAEELALSSKYKSEFLANMSHELRTPLNSILLLSKLLSENNDGNLNADQIEYATVINGSGNGLLELINEILDLSKIESGKMDVYKENIPVAYLTKNTDNIFKPLAKNKGISFISAIESDIPESIFTDRIKVEQVLKNLISNSMKFTENGEVKLQVYNADPNYVENLKLLSCPYVIFEVTDTGIGIPQNKLEQIFEAFQQADGSTRRKYGGTGLGLAISREIAHLLNGKIIVKSEVGVGSTFQFIIPATNVSQDQNSVLGADETTSAKKVIEVSESTTASLNPEAPEIKDANKPVYVSHKALVGKKILIVDDDNRNIFSLKNLLESQKIEVAVAMNGKEALKVMSGDVAFDIVLLDMMMPEMDGYETVREIRKKPEWKNLPVIALTAKVMLGDKQKCLEAGVSDYMTKPVVGENLLSLLRIWLHK